MAIESTSQKTTRTLVAGQHEDRMAPAPWIVGKFVRVEATDQQNAFGTIYEKHPEPWVYTIHVEDVPLIVELQKHALAIIVKEAFAENGTPKTDAEVSTLVDGLMSKGVSFDHARTKTWEWLEGRRRGGEALPIRLDVTEGKQRLTDAGFLR